MHSVFFILNVPPLPNLGAAPNPWEARPRSLYEALAEYDERAGSRFETRAERGRGDSLGVRRGEKLKGRGGTLTISNNVSKSFRTSIGYTIGYIGQ